MVSFAINSDAAKIAPQFSGYNQHDSQEFLCFLLEGLSINLNKVIGKPKYKELDFDKSPEKEASEGFWKYYKTWENSIILDYF